MVLRTFGRYMRTVIERPFVSVEPFHLLRNLDEQWFRFNRRKAKDADRFFEVLAKVVGKSTIKTAASLDKGEVGEARQPKTLTKMILFDVLKSSLACQTFVSELN